MQGCLLFEVSGGASTKANIKNASASASTQRSCAASPAAGASKESRAPTATGASKESRSPPAANNEVAPLVDPRSGHCNGRAFHPTAHPFPPPAHMRGCWEDMEPPLSMIPRLENVDARGYRPNEFYYDAHYYGYPPLPAPPPRDYYGHGRHYYHYGPPPPMEYDFHHHRRGGPPPPVEYDFHQHRRGGRPPPMEYDFHQHRRALCEVLHISLIFHYLLI
nr:extensin-3-like [Ipomoea batatas]